MKNRESKVFCGTTEIDCLDDKVSKENNPTIKIFKIELPNYYDIVDLLIKSLTPLEVARVQRYHHIDDKNRFIICRSLLKWLLAKETGVNNSQIYFEQHSNKKPYFPLDTSLFFNIAHAGNFAIIAIGDCELGVDIEMMDPSFDFTEILTSVFDETETTFISNSINKRYSFYKFWTRKEAIVKATGKGIDDDLCKIRVTDGWHNIPSDLMCDFKKITVLSFDINDDYIGALALTEAVNDFNKIGFFPLPTADELKFLIHKKDI